jgi:hypothetical protein
LTWKAAVVVELRHAVTVEVIVVGRVAGITKAFTVDVFLVGVWLEGMVVIGIVDVVRIQIEVVDEITSITTTVLLLRIGVERKIVNFTGDAPSSTLGAGRSEFRRRETWAELMPSNTRMKSRNASLGSTNPAPSKDTEVAPQTNRAFS